MCLIVDNAATLRLTGASERSSRRKGGDSRRMQRLGKSRGALLLVEIGHLAEQDAVKLLIIPPPRQLGSTAIGHKRAQQVAACLSSCDVPQGPMSRSEHARAETRGFRAPNKTDR
jgi:hypothetical protein